MDEMGEVSGADEMGGADDTVSATRTSHRPRSTRAIRPGTSPSARYGVKEAAKVESQPSTEGKRGLVTDRSWKVKLLPFEEDREYPRQAVQRA
jgi:hypothetical protein